MTFFSRNKMILAKIESTYGTDPTPVEGSNAIRTMNLTRKPYGGNAVARNLDLNRMGGDQMIVTGELIEISFDVELAGAASAGVAPHYGELLRACGLGETIVAVTSATYAHVSAGFESASIYFNYDGERQICVGARGDFSLNMSREGIPFIHFTFIGIYARPTAVAMWDPTFTDITPRAFNDANTTSFSVHSQAVFGAGFTYNANNEVNYRNLVGDTSVQISDRNPGGNVVFEAVPIATKDFYAAVESHAGTIASGAISIVHGATAGDICTISVPQSQLLPMEDTEQEKIRMFDIPFLALPTDTGNDEFSIAFT